MKLGRCILGLIAAASLTACQNPKCCDNIAQVKAAPIFHIHHNMDDMSQVNAKLCKKSGCKGKKS